MDDGDRVEVRIQGEDPSLRRDQNRQLLSGMVCVFAVANLQYGWTLFVNPMHEKYGWDVFWIQVAALIFSFTEAITPLGAGKLIDRYGPKRAVWVSGPLVGGAWIINSYATHVWILYITSVMAGIAAGLVFGAIYPNVAKWHPMEKGRALGWAAAAFTSLAALPVYLAIQYFDYTSTFFGGGIIQCIAIFMAVRFLRSAPSDIPRPQSVQPISESPPSIMRRSCSFKMLYAMFALVAAGGLILAFQLSPILNKIGFQTLPHLTFWILCLTGLANSLSRIIFGKLSDSNRGRESGMVVAFSCFGGSLVLISLFLNDGYIFAAASAVAFFFWGQIFTIFPALCNDWYGNQFASQNWGFLYTAKFVGALFVPLSIWLVEKLGWTWNEVFLCAGFFSFMAVALALMLRRHRVYIEAGRFGSE